MALASQLKTGTKFFPLGLVPAKGEVGGCPHVLSSSSSFLPLISSLFPVFRGTWRTLALAAASDGPAQSNECLCPNSVEYAV